MEFLKNLIDNLMIGGTAIAIICILACLYILAKETRRSTWTPRKR